LAISFRNLPDVRVLRNYLPSETSYIYDINGTLLYSLHDEANRDVVDLDDVSPEPKAGGVWPLRTAISTAHQGINPTQCRAVPYLANFREAGSTVEGGFYGHHAVGQKFVFIPRAGH
jgi:penicillin-binding protein 1A